MGRNKHISRAGRNPTVLVGASGVVVVQITIAKMIWITFAGIRIAKFMFSAQFTRRVRPFVNMAKTKYSPFEEINELQKDIMIFIDQWVRKEKTPVPRKAIMTEMKLRKVPAITAEWAVNALLRKGYIRRAYSGTNKTFYVQLRNIKYDEHS